MRQIKRLKPYWGKSEVEVIPLAIKSLKKARREIQKQYALAHNGEDAPKHLYAHITNSIADLRIMQIENYSGL